MAALRRTALADVVVQEEQIVALREQMEDLKEKDRLRLEEIKMYISSPAHRHRLCPVTDQS